MIKHLVTYLILIAQIGFAQVDITVHFELPKQLPEASGIESTENGYWIMNDSWNPTYLFHVDKSGIISDSVFIKAPNKDWEDLTQDNLGNIFIGDFGNNGNGRQDLAIYIVESSELLKDSAETQKINFGYANQTKFPAVNGTNDFDCEAFIFLDDSLFLFSKNRSESKYTKVYKIPALPGTYNPFPFDSIKTNGWITSADLTPNNKNLLLLSEDSIFICKNIKSNKINGTETIGIRIDSTKKEGITVDDNGDVIIVDEAFGLNTNKLYSFNLAKILGLENSLKPQSNFLIKTLGNEIKIINQLGNQTPLFLFSVEGKLLASTLLKTSYKIPAYIKPQILVISTPFGNEKVLVK